MIRHIVMFKFHEEANGAHKRENLQTAKNMLVALRDTIDVVRNIEVGLNSEEASLDNWDLVLTVDVDSFGDLDTYINHPEHKKVSAFMGGVRDLRACVDYVL